MRQKHKQWRNGKGGQWNARITWYGEGKSCSENIRLSLEDCDHTINYFPKTLEEADHAWFMFKQGAPPCGWIAEPFVMDLVRLLAKKYGTKC